MEEKKKYYKVSGVVSDITIKEAQTKEGPKTYAVAKLTTPETERNKSRVLPILTFYPEGIEILKKAKEGENISILGSFESFTGKDGKKKQTLAVISDATGKEVVTEDKKPTAPHLRTIEGTVVEKEEIDKGTRDGITMITYIPKGKEIEADEVHIAFAIEEKGHRYFDSLQINDKISMVGMSYTGANNDKANVSLFSTKNIEDLNKEPLRHKGIISDLQFKKSKTPLGNKEYASATVTFGEGKEKRFMPILTFEKEGVEYLKGLKNGDEIDGATKYEELKTNTGSTLVLKLLGKYINPQNKMVDLAFSGKKTPKQSDEMYIG
jgi:hypothetical protein